MVDTGIIQYHHDFSGGVFPQRPLQKTEEGRCVICPFFCTNDPTGFIIQGAYQFYPFVLSISGDFSLVAAEKSGAANGLVIPDHGFVLEQEVVNVAIQQFFFRLGKVSSKNTCCFLESAFLRVYVGRVQLSPSR